MKKLFVGAEFKALIMLAFPILCTQLLQVGMGTTDIAITGHFDALVQSGVAMGVFVWNPILLFASGTLMAVTILTAHQFGGNVYRLFFMAALLSLWFLLRLQFRLCGNQNIFCVSLKCKKM